MDSRDEEIRRLRAALIQERERTRQAAVEIKDRNHEIRVLNSKLAEAWDQIHLMRRTVSWRVTTPLRVVRMLMR